MALSELIFENHTDLQSLAILICHLFISGKFQLAHIIYDPKVFNDHIIATIDNECFGKVTWTTTDLTKSRPKKQNEKLNILELVFPKLDDPAWNAIFLDTSSLPYYLLMIPSDANNWIDSFESITFLHSNTLIVKQDQTNQTTHFYQKVRNKPLKFIYEYDESDPPENLFRETFEKVKSTWMLGAHYSTSAICFGEHYDQAESVLSFERFLANFYVNQIENSFLNGSNSACGNYSPSYSLGRSRSKSFYKELDLGVRLLNINSSKIWMNNETTVIGIHFDPFRLDSEKYPYAHVHNLYPFISVRYIAIFVYGEDYPRPHPPGILTILSVGNYWFIFIWFLLATIILFIIRWKTGTEQNDNSISSSILDMIVVFCGGGRLRFRNKYDKVYLMIMIIGAFFLLSLCTSKFKSRITSPKQLDNINTFEKLAKLKVPIYASYTCGNDTQHVFAAFKKKLKKKINVKGKSSIYELVQTRKAFVFITPASEIQLAEIYTAEQGHDIIQGRLAESPSNFILSSKRRIPRLVHNKINELTSRILESGIFNFFQSASQFVTKIRTVDTVNDGTDFRRVTMKQFYFPFMIYLIAMMISILIFISEIIYFNFQRRQRVFPYVE